MTQPTGVRKDLLRLDKRELQALNDGFEALVAIEGPGGYQHIAGIFGEPGRHYQPTDPALFLPWHRAYLIAFERLLGRIWPGVSLSYWDWTDDAASSTGIPGRLKNVAYSDKDQGVWLNQFCRAPIDCIGHESLTERSPGPPGDLKPLTEAVRNTLMQTTYLVFGANLAEVSREFRRWVGGHLANDEYAAYDPLFWFHHANFDRLWAAWQQANGNASVPEPLLDKVLDPFAIRVRDVLEIDRLAYTYDGFSGVRLA